MLSWGNEHGLMGRFCQNVGHVMGEVNQACGLRFRSVLA